MLKLTSAFSASFALCASVAFAGNEGAFAPVTSTLTITDYTTAPATTLANGNKQTVATWTTSKLTNAAIIAEAQRRELIPAGDISKWRLIAIAGSNELIGFAVTNGTDTVWIDDVITCSVAERRGFATKGRWTKTSGGQLVGGATTYLDGYVLLVMLNGTTYAATVAPTITDTLVRFNSGAVYVWKANPYTINVVGLPAVSGEDRSILRGGLSLGLFKASADLSITLPGFDGFEDEEND